jgi:hypothetical protein
LVVEHETHLIVPLDVPRAGHDCTFLSMVHLDVSHVGAAPQCVIWPFPNPGNRFCAFSYKLLRPDQTAQIPGAIQQICQMLHQDSPVQRQPIPLLDVSVAATFDELVLKLPSDDLVADFESLCSSTLEPRYGTNYGFVVAKIPPSTVVPCEFVMGWRWAAPTPFVAAAWAESLQASKRLLVAVFNTHRLEWSRAGFDDPGPARQNTCADEPMLRVLMSVDGKAAPLKCLVGTSIPASLRRNTDIVAPKMDMPSRDDRPGAQTLQCCVS